MPVETIKRNVESRLKELGYTRTAGLAPREAESLRSAVLSPLAILRRLDESRFELELSRDEFSRSLQVDWHVGMVRAQNQHAASQRLASTAEAPSAWSLVTTYYEGFFLAAELLRAIGKPLVFLDVAECASVSARMPSKYSPLERGLYAGIAQPPNAHGDIVLTFARQGGRQHMALWGFARGLISLRRLSAMSTSKRRMIALLDAILTGGGRWPWPSEVRNLWNYQDPHLYGTPGESAAGRFRGCRDSAGRVFGWAARPRLESSLENHAASIAYVTTVLRRSAEEVSPKLSLAE